METSPTEPPEQLAPETSPRSVLSNSPAARRSMIKCLVSERRAKCNRHWFSILLGVWCKTPSSPISKGQNPWSETYELRGKPIKHQSPSPSVRRKGPRWPLVAVAVLILVAGLAAVFWFVPVHYYALWPGPVEEVSDLVRVDGGPTVYELNGDLYMLTVSLREVNAFEFARGWIDPSVDLVAREAIRPEGVTPEEHRTVNLRLMDDSKETAIAVALRYLGLPVEYTGEGMLVMSVVEGSPADGLLEVGDVLVKIGETGVEIRDDGIEAILANEIGDTIPLTVQRADERIEIEITLAEHTDNPGRPDGGFCPRDLQPIARTAIRHRDRNPRDGGAFCRSHVHPDPDRSSHRGGSGRRQHHRGYRDYLRGR